MGKFAIKFTEKSLTQQHLKDETNINRIMEKYERSGVITHLSSRIAQYGDFSNVGTFHQAMVKLQEAQNLFNDVPSEIRKKFDNDPAKFIEFCSDENNIEELREMGLAEPAPVIKKSAVDPPITPSPDEE